MLVELVSLERQGGKFAHSYEPDELELNEERARLIVPPRVTGRIQKSDSKVTVSGEVTAELQLDCDRCLNSLILPMANEFKVEYVTPDVYHADQGTELIDDDLSLSIFDGEVVDIDELVREQLLLALPTQVLCREDCKGLCPVCGGDRNSTECTCQEAEVDRWAGLKEIVNRES